MAENKKVEPITIDLRYRQKTKSQFGIKDIHFSPLQNEDNFNVPKMILIEKQPRYPIYYANINNALVGVMDGLKKFLNAVISSKAGKSSDLLGSFGGGVVGQITEVAAKSVGNYRIERYSRNPAEYYSDPNLFMNNIKNLFTTVNGSKICSYELPFMSEYFLEADGDAGWQSTGMDAQYGELARTLTNYNVGFPITPNWTYDSKKLSTEFSFNLINDTTEHLKDNLMFIHTIIPGMMHVLVNGSKMGEGSSLAQAAQNVMGSITTLFKSPNVYEVIVPGRFRWLWCTAQMDIKYKGKIYNEDVSSLGYNYIGNAIPSSLIAFPEAYEVSMTINSLLPQSFNEFYYGISQGNVGITTTETLSTAEKMMIEGKKNAEKVVERAFEKAKQSLNYLNPLIDNKQLGNAINKTTESLNNNIPEYLLRKPSANNTSSVENDFLSRTTITNGAVKIK